MPWVARISVRWLSPPHRPLLKVSAQPALVVTHGAHSQTLNANENKILIGIFRGEEMFKTGISLGAVLTVMSWGAVYADATKIAHAANGEARLGGAQHRDVDSADLVFNENQYEIQPETSKMKFRVDSPIGDVWGRFDDFEGSFMMLGNSIDDDMASIEINAESLDADAGFIGMMLKSERFFDVENFPSMRFVGTSLKWYKNKGAILKGDLTIKNVTKQVAFYVEVVDADVESGKSERLTVKASTTIRRSAFGIDTMLPAVSDNVNLFMTIDAVKKQHSISMR
jgi:polyisoprenoid-binding protein YceI